MNPYILDSALEVVFFEDYNPDNTRTLNGLCCLFSYYKDDDATAELDATYNKLQALLIKIQLFNKVTQYPSITTEFTCKFNDSDQDQTKHTFAPVFKMPPLPELKDRIAEIKEIEASLSELDLASMVDYVKKKAKEAGDFAFEEEE